MATYKIQKHNLKKRKNAIRIVRKRVKDPILRQTTQLLKMVQNNPNIKHNKYLRNTKHVPCFYRVIETRVEVWENEMCCGNTSRRREFPQPFRVLPINFHECFYNSIETRRTCFLFLLENTATRKRKTTCQL